MSLSDKLLDAAIRNFPKVLKVAATPTMELKLGDVLVFVGVARKGHVVLVHTY